MQGRLWSKKVWGGAFAVAPKPEVGMSLWRPLCLPAVSAQQEPCSEQEQDWVFLVWWIFSCTGVFEMNVFHMFKNIYEIWGSECWDCCVLVQAVSCLLRWLGLLVFVPGESTFFHLILVQLPVMPRECGMCKAVGFHPHLPLFSMISFYSEHSKISMYPEVLNFYKLNGKMSSKHQAKLWK